MFTKVDIRCDSLVPRAEASRVYQLMTFSVYVYTDPQTRGLCGPAVTGTDPRDTSMLDSGWVLIRLTSALSFQHFTINPRGRLADEADE